MNEFTDPNGNSASTYILDSRIINTGSVFSIEEAGESTINYAMNASYIIDNDTIVEIASLRFLFDQGFMSIEYLTPLSLYEDSDSSEVTQKQKVIFLTRYQTNLHQIILFLEKAYPSSNNVHSIEPLKNTRWGNVIVNVNFNNLNDSFTVNCATKNPKHLQLQIVDANQPEDEQIDCNLQMQLFNCALAVLARNVGNQLLIERKNLEKSSRQLSIKNSLN